MKPIRSLLRRSETGTPHASGDRTALRKRIAVLLAVLAVPAMAAPGDFGAIAGAAPIESESVAREMAAMPAMPFERPGMSFPGSAYFFLADPLDTGLTALPSADPLGGGAEDGRRLGELIDAGPAARPFVSSVVGSGHSRALECLSQAVWYEAASESEAGQRAVAQVVLNRVAHPSWPGSVCGVVYQGSQRPTGCQFTFTCDGSLARKASGASWRRARAIASDALSGSVYAPVGHATHYHTLWVNPSWASSLDHIGTIGAHRFYRNRGAGGEKSAFVARYSGSEPSVGARTASPSTVGTSDTAAAPRIEYEIGPAGTAPPPRDAALAEPAAAADGFGKVGQVRQEYAQAGQWKQRPKKPVEAEAASAQDQP
ncbi:cell wall hydrolase [Erythrobacter sp. GH1-10]|uniref:cell wall hydrolase n=1 Tax=Erythrobacter sp. GH1-10 TaxID=3349334 RepID=UPI003877A661